MSDTNSDQGFGAESLLPGNSASLYPLPVLTLSPSVSVISEHTAAVPAMGPVVRYGNVELIFNTAIIDNKLDSSTKEARAGETREIVGTDTVDTVSFTPIGEIVEPEITIVQPNTPPSDITNHDDIVTESVVSITPIATVTESAIALTDEPPPVVSQIDNSLGLDNGNAPVTDDVTEFGTNRGDRDAITGEDGDPVIGVDSEIITSTTTTDPITSETVISNLPPQFITPQFEAEPGGMAESMFVPPTSLNQIDGLLDGRKWSQTSITYSFPDNLTTDYGTDYDRYDNHITGFTMAPPGLQSAVRQWLGNISSVVPLSFLQLDNTVIGDTGLSDGDATLRVALSNDPNPSYAYTPYPSDEAGDVWFNQDPYGTLFTQAQLGEYGWHTVGHELGHALGLKHGHEQGGVAGVALPANWDSMEFSLMTYRTYENQTLGGPYTNAAGHYAQSLMVLDIQALQILYGANFTANAEDTVYEFSPTTGEMFVNGRSQGVPVTNTIFRTIWDGNGIDTYDLSDYTTPLLLDLNPGAYLDLDVDGIHQRANLNGLNLDGSGETALESTSTTESTLTIETTAISDSTSTGDATFIGDVGLIEPDVVIGADANDGEANDDLTDDAPVADSSIYARGHVFNAFLFNDDPRSLIENAISGTADDQLIGNQGNNRLDGGDGNDRLDGRDGDDVLLDGTGEDWLTGGLGADVFVLAADNQPDYIMDFDVTSDRLDLSAWRISDAAQLTLSTVPTGSQLQYQQEIVYLDGVVPESIDATTLIGVPDRPLVSPTDPLMTHSITGQVRQDKDEDGDITDIDQGIGGVTIHLFADANQAGVADGEAIATTTTDAYGFYRFQDLANGPYVVKAVAPSGYESGTDVAGGTHGQVQVNLDTPALTGQDFLAIHLFPEHPLLVLNPALANPVTDVSISDAITEVEGTDDGDRWQGTDANERFHGKNGDDTLDGRNGDDWLLGESGDDVLVGNGGNDHLNGGEGNDSLSGTTSNILGANEVDVNEVDVNEIDVYVGGLGQDTFILGDIDQVYYGSAGRDDYAWLSDFEPASDILVLHGSANQYSTAIANGYTELWLRPVGDAPAELIAYFHQTRDITLQDSSVQYV